MRWVVPLALLALAYAGPAPADEQKQSDLQVTAAWSRLAAPGSRILSGYLTVRNTGQTADTLLRVTSPLAADVTMHTMVIEDGIAKMRALPDGVQIDPGKSVVFEPGGLHLMLAKPLKTPKLGETIPVELVFRSAGSVETGLKVMVSAPAGDNVP